MAENSGGGNWSAWVSVLGMWGVAFVVLKLCGVIDWDWTWVLAPFWIPVAAVLLVLLGMVVVAVVAAVFGRG
jgi:phosphoglycerol transferase MdoB-like AlkP superfamily enzyme